MFCSKQLTTSSFARNSSCHAPSCRRYQGVKGQPFGREGGDNSPLEIIRAERSTRDTRGKHTAKEGTKFCDSRPMQVTSVYSIHSHFVCRYLEEKASPKSETSLELSDLVPGSGRMKWSGRCGLGKRA